MTTTTSAATPDYDEIVRVVQLYIDGFNGAGIAKFREAFHENASYFFTRRNGTLEQTIVSNCFKEWATPRKEPIVGPTVVGRIISVSQAGDVASVLLGWDYIPNLSVSCVDIHSLLRIDAIWKITNKTATHSSRAAWAGAK